MFTGSSSDVGGLWPWRCELPYSAAHEVFVDDVLFAVVDVRLDEGQPLVVIRSPAARRVGAVLVDRALGSRANLAESVLDLAQGTKPVDCGGRGSIGGKGDPLVIAQRGQSLDEGVVPVSAGRDDPSFEAEPVDQSLDPGHS